MPLNKIQTSYDVDVVGTERLVTATFPIASVQVNNPSGMWLYIPEVDKYIPSSTLAWISNILPPTSTVHLLYVDGLVGGAVSAVTGGPITVTVYNEYQTETNGLDYSTATSGDIAAVLAELALANAKLDLLITETALQGIQLNTLIAGQALQATAAAQATAQASLTSLVAGQALQATAAKQDTQSGKLDTLIANDATQNTKLDSIISNTQPINNALTTANITVTTTATLIRTAVGREVIGMVNMGAVDVTIGPSSVVAGTGLLLRAGREMSMAINGISVYGRTASSSAEVRTTRGALT